MFVDFKIYFPFILMILWNWEKYLLQQIRNISVLLKWLYGKGEHMLQSYQVWNKTSITECMYKKTQCPTFTVEQKAHSLLVKIINNKE